MTVEHTGKAVNGPGGSRRRCRLIAAHAAGRVTVSGDKVAIEAGGLLKVWGPDRRIG